MYAIREWDEHFETNDTRKLKRLAWIKVPVKLDGWGYAHLLDHKDGAAHLGCWVALLELASMCKPRGTLNRPTGEPMTLHDICRQTRIPMPLMEAAITRLSSMGWVESPDASGKSPDVPGDCRDFFPDRGEESRGEEKRVLTRSSAEADPGAKIVQRVWNENRGPLPSCEAVNGARERRMRLLHAEAKGDEILLASTVAAFAKDPFNRQRGYGIDTLTRAEHRSKWLDRGRHGYEPSNGRHLTGME